MKTAITGVEIPGNNLLCLTIGGHDVMHLHTAYSDEITKPLDADQVQAVFVAVMAGLGFGADGKPLPSEDSALALLRRVLPFAESRAEDMQGEMDGYVEGSPLWTEAKGYADPATAAVDAAKAFLAGAPVAPDVNADMLAALRDLVGICRGGSIDPECRETVRRAEALAARAGWQASQNAGTPPARVGIVCDLGGVVGVFSDNPALIGQPYTTLDYDVEGIEAARCIKVRQPDGTDREAYARDHVIGAAAIPILPAEAYPAADLDEDEDAGEEESAMPRMPVTSDLGFMIRDMIEGQSFELLDTGGDEVIKVGHDHVDSVDCSDIDNLRVYTRSGALFVVRIIREG